MIFQQERNRQSAVGSCQPPQVTVHVLRAASPDQAAAGVAEVLWDVYLPVSELRPALARAGPVETACEHVERTSLLRE